MEGTAKEKLNTTSAIRTVLLILLALELLAAAVLSTRLFKSDGGRTHPISLAEERAGSLWSARRQPADGPDGPDGEESGFSIKDETTVWETETQVEIFHLRYDDNGDLVYTVESGQGDKVLAPGTENRYSFTLMNTLRVPMNYILDVECRGEGDEDLLPVEVRLSDASGRYLLGGSSAWAPIRELDGITDQQDMGAQESREYILDWRWPFERSDETNGVAIYDGHDTDLGDDAVSRDITLTLVLRTNAEIGRDYAGRSWALVNLICTVLTSAIGVYEIVLFLLGRKGDEELGGEENERLRRQIPHKLWGIIPMAGAVTAFLLTEDMRLPMTWTDRWTLLMAVLLAMSVTVGLLTRGPRRGKPAETHEEAKETVGAK